ncbi:hypothetical protein BDR07DRAFT_1419928 [Suillus spraguei]|nr:hypothetical protein BDR07DRAFT_1419928 [Suillus spraguei]
MSSSTQVTTDKLHVDPRSTYGAFLIGCILTALLFGVTNIQAFIYVRTHAGRWTKFYKSIVLLLWTLDAMQLALTVHCVYYYLVTNFANTGALVEVVWSLRLQVAFNVLTVYMIHLLYSHRIWIVGRDRSVIFRIIPGIVVILSSGSSFILIYLVYNHNPEDGGFFMKRWSVFMGFSVATFLDVLVTCSLLYLLASFRTGMSNTDSLITRLICYTINCGCLTSICALASIIICAAMPHNLIFLSVQFLVGKLYINSYIALLNTGSYLARSVPDATDSFKIHREPHRDSASTGHGSCNITSHERFPSFRKTVLAHPEIDVAPPTRPLGAVNVNTRKSILVTVEKESFVDL